MAETKLFNIRIETHKHKAFKEYASKKGLSMGGILHNYIDQLLEGEMEPVGFDEGQTQAKWEDPVAAIRSQYVQGRDF